MNERTAKILKKAGFKPTEIAQTKLGHQLEKIVELVVRDCAKLADEGHGSHHFGLGIAGYQVLERYGVKEK